MDKEETAPKRTNLRYQVIETFDNGETAVWQTTGDAFGTVGTLVDALSLLESPSKDRFHASLPETTHITIEVIR